MSKLSLDGMPRVADWLHSLRDDAERYGRVIDEMCEQARETEVESIPLDHDECASAFAAVIDELCDKPVQESDYVVVPQVCAEDDLEPDIVRIDCVASLYKAHDLPLARAYEGLAPAMTGDEIHESMAEVPTLVSYAIDFAPWSESANYHVHIPDDLSGRQLAKFAKDLLWEITFMGMTETDAQERTDELLEKVQAGVDEIEAAKERGEADTCTRTQDIRGRLRELIGDLELEYSDAMHAIMTPIAHNLWLAHARRLARLADDLGL